MKQIKITIVFLLLLFTAQISFAQSDSTNKKNDSLNAAKLVEFNKRIIQIEEQRIADSVTKAELETQISSLKTTDNLKKEELQKQLQDLNDKETKRLAQKKAQIDSLRKTATAHPVLGFFNDSLFLIYSKLGSFSAKDRAEAISNRINKLVDNFSFSVDSLKIAGAETTVDIVFKETIIMSISENDALWNNVSKEELAQKYKTIIGNAVVEYKKATSFSTLAKQIGLALLVIIIIIFPTSITRYMQTRI